MAGAFNPLRAYHLEHGPDATRRYLRVLLWQHGGHTWEVERLLEVTHIQMKRELNLLSMAKEPARMRRYFATRYSGASDPIR